MNNLQNPRAISLVSFLLLASFASVGAVLPMPALPDIAQYFQVPVTGTEIIMGIYLVGYALGQLVYGPLANHYGRKSALLIGVMLASAGGVISLLSAILHNFTLLVAARFLIALGAAAGLVIRMIMIRDIYDEVNARKTFAKVVLSFALVPFLATALGGALTHYFGWTAINTFMDIYTLLLFVIVLRLPETLNAANQRAFSPVDLFKAYQGLFQQKEYFRLIFLFAIGSTTSYVFNSLAPLLVIKTLHVSSMMYGWLSAIPSIGILLGGYLSNRFAERVKAIEMIRAGIYLVSGGSLMLALLFKFNCINLPVLYSSAIIIFCGSSLLIPNASMQALSHVRDYANGSSVMNATALIFSSLFVSVAGKLSHLSVLVLPGTLVCVGLLGVMLLSINTKQRALKNQPLLFACTKNECT